MLSAAWRIARKDLRLALGGGQGLIQAVLLGLLLVFLFSLSQPVGALTSGQAAATIFWMASAFALVLVFNTLYAYEEETGARAGLILSGAPAQAVWLGKALAGFLLLAISQAVFAPATIVFLGQSSLAAPLTALAALVVVDWGLAAVGSLLGALSQAGAARESLLSVLCFPLLTPVLLAGIRTGAAALEPMAGVDDSGQWLSLALGFDAMFSAAGLALFAFVYQER